MAESASSALASWTSFYVVTGSAAAALTGLMFIVITLVTGLERSERNPEGTSIFSTPTVVHFSAAFVISAMLTAPWHSLFWLGLLLACGAFVCAANIVRVSWRISLLARYHADLEDWSWYTILPLIAYLSILGGAVGVATGALRGLTPIAAGVALLVIIGIHNAWDIVTYLATRNDD
jgi:hypothetical protein